MFQTHLPTSWWPLVKTVFKGLSIIVDALTPYAFAYLAITAVAPGLPWKSAFWYTAWSVFAINAVMDNHKNRKHKK